MKAVFFDAAGTLFHLPRGVGWHYARAAEKHGGYLSAEIIDRRFRTLWGTMPPSPETDGPRPDDDRGWWRSLVHRVFSDAPPTFNLDACFSDLWEEFTRPGVWELYPETLEVLQALKAKARLGIISNFDGRLRSVLSNLGLADFFEHIVISSEVGADKPSPRIFTHALKRFELEAKDVVFTGDDPEADWLGAERAGMKVFRLKRPDNDLRGLLQ